MIDVTFFDQPLTQNCGLKSLFIFIFLLLHVGEKYQEVWKNKHHTNSMNVIFSDFSKK